MIFKRVIRRLTRSLFGYWHVQSCWTCSMLCSTERCQCTTIYVSLIVLTWFFEIRLTKWIELSRVQGRLLYLIHVLVDFSLVNHHLFMPVITLSAHFAMFNSCLFSFFTFENLLASNHRMWLCSETWHIQMCNKTSLRFIWDSTFWPRCLFSYWTWHWRARSSIHTSMERLSFTIGNFCSRPVIKASLLL